MRCWVGIDDTDNIDASGGTPKLVCGFAVRVARPASPTPRERPSIFYPRSLGISRNAMSAPRNRTPAIV
jgi:hypothetical protein